MKYIKNTAKKLSFSAGGGVAWLEDVRRTFRSQLIKTFRTLAIALTLALLVAIVPATPALAQTITLSPTSGTIGTTVTVTGSGFTPGVIVWVYFNTEPRTVTAINSNGVINASFTVPTSTPGVASITVRDGSSYTTSLQLAFALFTVLTVTMPEITLTPSSGEVGAEIKVSGTGFAASKSVTISFDDDGVGNTVTNSLGSFTDATVTVPESYRGSHILTTKDASQNLATATFNTKHRVTMSSSSGAIGSEVAVSGTGFNANENITITFDGSVVTTSPAAVTTSSKGSFSARFNVPAASSSSHEVEASDGTNKANQPFTTTVANVSFRPLEGYAGDEVTVSGSGFIASQPVTVVFYDKDVKTGPTNSDGSFSISFPVPDLAGGNYQMRVSDGINTVENYFKLKILTSANINPTTSVALPGHVGTEATISGVGFFAGRTVTITYDGVPVAMATVNADGSFSATFPAPASNRGAHIIIAADGVAPPQQFAFIMESTPPPTPQPLKPEMGIKTEAEARFDWEEVTDLSLPITYTLQVATQVNFTEGSIVLEKKGLTRSEYTITAGEKLEPVSQKTPYYWRVRAIDGAANESQWSGTGSFYVAGLSLLPQPVIYTLFGIAALLLGILGFWLGRKTAYY